jgi:hypothetical protein
MPWALVGLGVPSCSWLVWLAAFGTRSLTFAWLGGFAVLGTLPFAFLRVVVCVVRPAVGFGSCCLCLGAACRWSGSPSCRRVRFPCFCWGLNFLFHLVLLFVHYLAYFSPLQKHVPWDIFPAILSLPILLKLVDCVAWWLRAI